MIKMSDEQKGSINFTTIIMLLIIAVMGVMGVTMLDKEQDDNVVNKVAASPKISTTAKENYKPSIFSDGLRNVAQSTSFNLDETGAGIAKSDMFLVDINQDGYTDKITKTRNETGTAHFWEEYKIEINKNGNWYDITPSGFRTTEGTECALQKIQFVFEPKFKVIKISRPWKDSWNTPSEATKTIYEMKDGKLTQTKTEKMGVICDVSQLFLE